MCKVWLPCAKCSCHVQSMVAMCKVQLAMCKVQLATCKVQLAMCKMYLPGCSSDLINSLLHCSQAEHPKNIKHESLIYFLSLSSVSRQLRFDTADVALDWVEPWRVWRDEQNFHSTLYHKIFY